MPTASLIIPIQVQLPEFEIYLTNLRFSMESVAKQTVDCEKILVDYGSNLNYSMKIRELCRVYGFKYIFERAFVWSRSRSLNVGISIASGEYVLVIDSDSVIPPDYVEQHMEKVTPNVVRFSLVYDAKKEMTKSSDYQKLIKQKEHIIGLRMAGRSHVCVPREWFLLRGGYDERYSGWGGEDDEIYRRLSKDGFREARLDCHPVHLWHPEYKDLMASVGRGELSMGLMDKNHALLDGRRPITNRYGMFSIDSKESVNLGNRLIEYAVKKVLKLGEPAVKVSMFKIPSPEEIQQLNSCGFVLLPGSTILADGPGQGEALACLKAIRVPKFCVGASGWGPKLKPNLEAIKRITPPIGCRDPQILEVCKDLGVEAMLVGCPTAYLPFEDSTLPEIPYSIIGFARDELKWQQLALEGVPGIKYASLQEPYFEKGFAACITDKFFDYNDPRLVMKHYGRCHAVYTGRLHGLLPALSQQKPVSFFGHQDDSRFTLIRHLGIKIKSMNGRSDLQLTDPEKYIHKLDELKYDFSLWAHKTVNTLYDREEK